jgi:hypothetical protein
MNNMTKEKSMNQINTVMTEENLIQIYKNFQPIPSLSFYSRIQKAPWTKRYRVTRYALQVAVLMATIAAVIFVNPINLQPLSATNTPTSTPTMGTTDLSTHAQISTEIPHSLNTSIPIIPSITPSN